MKVEVIKDKDGYSLMVDGEVKMTGESYTVVDAVAWHLQHNSWEDSETQEVADYIKDTHKRGEKS